MWKQQLEHPAIRQFNPEYHGPLAWDKKTKMDLSNADALAVLRTAVYDTSAPTDKCPSLWGFRNGAVYRFMYDNVSRWHGYQTTEKVPTAILREWKGRGLLSNADYQKRIKAIARGN